MLIVPRTITEALTWGESHRGEWASAFASIGLTQAQIEAFTDALKEATAARASALDIEIAKVTATAECKHKVKRFREVASDMLATIKAYAEQQENPSGVLGAAWIPPSRQPSSAPPPGKPQKFSVALLALGQLVLKWKCKNPYGTSGTIYEIHRSVDDKEFAILGHVGIKTFVDTTVPAGSATVTYRIRAVRSTLQGEMSVLEVNLGVQGISVAGARSGIAA